MRDRFVPVTMGSPKFTTTEVGGFFVTEAHFPAGLVLPMHVHERATVAVMLSGSFSCEFPTRALNCQAGALHSEPAEDRHGNRVGSAGAHVLVIQPSAEAANALGRNAQVLQQVSYAPHSLAFGPAWRLTRELYLRDTATPLAIEGLVLELLAEAVRATLQPALNTIPPWAERAREYAHAHFRKSFRLSDVAREVDVSSVRLARGFRRYFGASVASYVRQLRVDWAESQLRSTEFPLSIIAKRAGFADQSHFTRTFRKYTGFTPERFRRNGTRSSTPLG